MIKNYAKIAFRNLLKYRGYTATHALIREGQGGTWNSPSLAANTAPDTLRPDPAESALNLPQKGHYKATIRPFAAKDIKL